jgi:hypothetical protein
MGILPARPGISPEISDNTTGEDGSLQKVPYEFYGVLARAGICQLTDVK